MTALPGLSMKIPLVAVAVAAKPSPMMGPKIPMGRGGADVVDGEADARGRRRVPAK